MKHHFQKNKVFCSHLNMEDITDADSAHAKRVCKDFKVTNLREYHDSYVQSDRLFLACFVPKKTPKLIALKNIQVKLDLLIDINMLLMVRIVLIPKS